MTAQQRLSSLLPPSHASIGALLSTQGVKSVASLLSADRASLDGVDPAAADALARALAFQLVGAPRPALEAYRAHLAHNVLLSFGLPSLDRLLGGGLRTGEVVELCGAPGCGKTQLCVAACVELVASTQQATALYVDAAGGFRAERAWELLRSSVMRRGGPMDEAARRAWKARLGPQLRVHRAPRLHALAGTLEALHAALEPRPDGAAADGDGDGGELGDGAWRAQLRLLVVDCHG